MVKPRKAPSSAGRPHPKRRYDFSSLLMVAFLSAWIFGLFYLHGNLDHVRDKKMSLVVVDSSGGGSDGHQEKPSGQQQVERSLDNEGNNNNNNVDNPWYGWQTDYSQLQDDDPTCHVRTCFVQKGKFEDHPSCPFTCRDDPADLHPVSPIPHGWIPDATMLHRMFLDGHDAAGNPWPPTLQTEYCEEIGVFGGPTDDNKKLLDGVPVRGMLPSRNNPQPGPKIFCGVYTMEVNHAGSVRAMRETWAPHCDGFVAFSTASDPRIPALAIEHEGMEEYENMWQKSRAIWKYIGDHYLEQFDYFILGGEDLLVIPENLRQYLSTLQQTPDDDLFAGRRFKGYGKDNYFNSGGAGYVLSRGTLRKYITTGYDHPHCNPHRHTAMEDVMIAECLRKVFNIGLTDTRDDQARERFHPFAPGNHLSWAPPQPGVHDWYFDYNQEWGLKQGLECCAPDSVSFHYIKKAANVRHIWSLLYLCNDNNPA